MSAQETNFPETSLDWRRLRLAVRRYVQQVAISVAVRWTPETDQHTLAAFMLLLQATRLDADKEV